MSLLGIRPIPPSPPSSSAAFGSHLPFQSQLQLPGPQRPLQFPRTHRHRARALRVEEYLPYMREGRSRGEMAVRYECRRVKQKENPFDRLPNEMVLRIFKNLGPSSLAAASGVCRRFKVIRNKLCLPFEMMFVVIFIFLIFRDLHQPQNYGSELTLLAGPFRSIILSAC